MTAGVGGDPGRVPGGDAATVAVLTNPAAGRGRYAGLLPQILTRLGAAGHPVHVVQAGSAAEAPTAVRAVVDAGAAAVVAVGGDGTVHLALQAVAGRGVPFGVVPAGTGNDFATALGLPTDPLAAAGAIAAALAAGETRPIDAAQVSTPDGRTRWYAAVLGAGFDAIVNERANRMRWPRGPLRYDLAIFVELLRLRARRYTLRLDGVAYQTGAVLVAVGNTDSYGGGMRICPAADPTDGLLDIVVAARMGRLRLLSLKPRLRRGTHVGNRRVSTFRAGTVEIAAAGIVAYADGERTFALPVTITCVPGAIRLLG